MTNVLFSPSSDFSRFYKIINVELAKQYNVINIADEMQDKFFLEFNKDNIFLNSIKFKIDKREIGSAEKLIYGIEKKLRISFNTICSYDRHIDRVNVLNEVQYPKSKIGSLYNSKAKDAKVMALVVHMNKLILSLNPKFLIMSPGNIYNNILISVANFHNIKTYFLFYPKTHEFNNGRRYMSNTYNAKHPNIQEEFNNLVGSCKYKASVEAKTLVRDFISHPKSMDPHAKHTYSRSIRKILINIKNILYGRHKNLSNYSNFSSIMDNFKCILKYPGQIKINTREKKDLSQIKFIYFPFHQLPELTVYMWADDFSDQTHIVKKLSTHIPFRLKLLVREHTHNVGRRPYTYYNLWKKISNIIVGSIYRSQYEYIKHSESVITINGSTGWEALLLKKPLFTLQNTLYDLTGYHKKLDNISQIGGVYNDHCEFINNMSDKKYYLKIYAYIDAVINTTVKENQGGAKKLIENIKLNSSLNNQEYNFWKK